MARVLHASYSGYFPYCILPFNISEEIGFVSSVSLEEAMALFWKARKIKISGTYQAIIPEIETRDFEITWERDAENEAGLVCNPGFRIVSQKNISQAPFPPILGFTDNVTRIGDSYVCAFRIDGFLADTFEEGFVYENPRQEAGPQSFFLENTEITGNGPEDTKIEIVEYWPYKDQFGTSLYDIQTGQLI